MRYIGNIISKSEKYRFNRFINVGEHIEIDGGTPTIVVGIHNAERIIGKENMNYINRVSDENLFWTFATIEKRSENEKDIERFKKIIIQNLKKRIKYNFFNVLTCSKTKFRGFLNFLQNKIPKFFYFTDKMLYISYEDKVMGISLNDCEYVGVTKKKIYDRIYKSFHNVTDENHFLTEEEKTFFENNNILIAAMFCYAKS